MALFSITTRAVGETLTAAKYNSDRNEIVAGIAPDTIPSTESDVSHANVTTDPGEAGSESLAGNMTGVIDRIKFVLGEIKGVAWRTTNTTKMLQLHPYPGTGVINPIGGLLPDDVDADIYFMATIPLDYVAATNMSLNMVISATATGTATFQLTVTRIRAGVGGASIYNNQAFSIVVGASSTGVAMTPITISGTNFLASDSIFIRVKRFASSDAGDTLEGNVFLGSSWITYTGIAGRG
jgi:hypothetical protein